MRILGITMSIPLKFEMSVISNTYGFGHDAAAVLVEDGILISGIEEERLNRIKHTNKAPISAMKFCLYSNHLILKDIDAIAVNFDETYINSVLKEMYLLDRKQKEFYDARFYVHRAVIEAFGEDVEDNKIIFVPHHIAHAESTYALSGFDESLVLVIDGMGDNIAATLQYSLEEIVLHILKEYSKVTGHLKLCLAGGVAHNCSLNGKLLYSGLFQDIFVQPAAHDAGGAIGAALHIIKNNKKNINISRLDNVYFGTNIGDSNEILDSLNKWHEFINFRKSNNIEKDTAKLLSEGSVIGWVQGRSEFGPRALGNRSILADPRPSQNKVIINEMVKKRESYRPFAPSVLDEYIDQYFILPTNQKQFPFMNFVLKVKEEKQPILGAVTHIDGTARVQTVSKSTNVKYWSLINEFSKLTGVHILLNTSFNNNAEPIVDSVEDSIVCFLTTKLNYLIIDNYIISKKKNDYKKYLNMIPNLVPHILLCETKKFSSFNVYK